MKNITKYIITACAFACLTCLQSCTTDFRDINSNPNDLSTIQAHHLTEPLLYGGTKLWTEYTWFWNSEIIQYTAFTGTTRPEHRYQIADGNWQTWYRFLSRYASNANHMRMLAEEEQKPAYYAMGTTLEVLYVSNLTDIFGDIPYKEAFRREGNITPAYDTQEEVYKMMFERLEEANGIYSENPAFSNGDRDPMYAGSAAGWRKFNNSLYLRLLMRVSGRTGMNAGAKIAEILNDPAKYPVFESNADNASVRFKAESPYQNWFYENNTSSASFTERKFTRQMIKMTVLEDGLGNEVVDPRFLLWSRKKNDEWKGVVSGSSGDILSQSGSNATEQESDMFVWAACPYVYMDYAEVMFIYAEAALKGFIPGGKTAAKQYYDEGLSASVEKWRAWGASAPKARSVDDAQVSAFYALPEVTFYTNASDEELLELVGNQKYLALYWTGMEAWHEYRRTGYPELTIGPNVANEGILPTRFGYPASVYTVNNNCLAVIDRNGGNNMRVPVWWSKRAIGN